MSWNKNSGYGQALLNMVQAQVPTFGNILIVFDPDDSDEKNYQHMQEIMSPDYDGQIRFYTNLQTAYDAAESNNNDVILVDANSTHVLTAGLDWSKNRVHLIGMDGGDRLVQQGTKVWLTTAATTAYVIKVTGVRNSFRNIKFIQAATAGTGLTVMQEGGEGTLWKNCSFIFEVADNLDQTNCYEVIAGSDSATYIDCEFGQDNLVTSVARTVFCLAVVTTGQEFKSNRLRNCTFVINSSSADALFISGAATSSIKFTNLFDNCRFLATINATSSSIALTKGITTPNGLVEGSLMFANPVGMNVTNLVVNGTNNDNCLVYGAVNTGTDLVGVVGVAT